MTQLEFIEKIAPLCVKFAKKYGYKIASPAIAQACLESGYGTSYKAQFNNFFGLKFRNGRVSCHNGFFENGGTEQQPDGRYTQLPSNTAWYSFSNYENAVEGYYQFIAPNRYAAVREATTPLQYLQAIKNAGYASSINYVQNVYAVVQNWGLTKYDNFNEQQTTAPIFIIQKNGTHNTTIKNNREINWIVLHYTAGTTSAKGAAQNTANWFMNPASKGSADFIVDDVEIVQYNAEPKNRYCWAVGGNKYSNKINSLAGIYYGQCKNYNSISIEMCSKKRNTSTLSVTDNDWYLTELTVENAVKLTKYLMQVYNIDINHVIMHNMVTGKWCPQPWSKNEDALQGWYNFLAQVKGTTAPTTSSNSDNNNNQNVVIEGGVKVNYYARIIAETLNVRSGPGTMYEKTMQVKKGSVYTIVAEQNGFGKLKSGAGWISLDYIEQVNLQTGEALPAAPYLIRVTADSLNVREGPGTEYKIVRTVSRPSIYTIVETKNGWGRLKSGVGWIKLAYTERYEKSG